MNVVESFMEAPHQGADGFFEEPSQLAVKQEGIIRYETIQLYGSLTDLLG